LPEHAPVTLPLDSLQLIALILSVTEPLPAPPSVTVSKYSVPYAKLVPVRLAACAEVLFRELSLNTAEPVNVNGELPVSKPLVKGLKSTFRVQSAAGMSEKAEVQRAGVVGVESR
jgi:hypothetical protein